MSYGADVSAIGIASEAAKVGRLESIIADALAAMDKGEYGQARRILRTGKDAPLLAVTGVLTKGMG